MDNTIYLQLLAVLALVGLNGFFVATEFALVSIRKSRVELLAADGNKQANLVLRTLQNLDEYIAATQLGITIASIGLGWIGEPALASLLDPLFKRIVPENLAIITAHGVAFLIAFAIITMLHVVFGELAPKSIALQYPEQTSMVVARPATIFLFAMRPIILLFNGMGRAVIRLVGIKEVELHQQIYTADEIELIVASSSERGELEDYEERIIRSALVFADQTASEVMVPRTEVITLSANATLDDIRETVRIHPYSRFPVYGSNPDNILGILHVRDILPMLMNSSVSRQIVLAEHIRPAYVVPGMLPIDKLLVDLKENHVHIAIVADEFGGIDGVVTLEDIVERLIGEVPNEYGQPSLMPEVQHAGAMLLSGLTPVVDINTYLGVDLNPTDTARTIGGYLFAQLGREPQVGDSVSVGTYELTITELDGLRISQIRADVRNNEKN